jgi:exopolyphosphatase/pppGpp-phosphohydrolase
MDHDVQRLFASIDIGTNSVLLLIAELKKDTSGIWFRTLREEQQIPRLGKGVDAHKTLAKESYP